MCCCCGVSIGIPIYLGIGLVIQIIQLVNSSGNIGGTNPGQLAFAIVAMLLTAVAFFASLQKTVQGCNVAIGAVMLSYVLFLISFVFIFAAID